MEKLQHSTTVLLRNLVLWVLELGRILFCNTGTVAYFYFTTLLLLITVASQ